MLTTSTTTDIQVKNDHLENVTNTELTVDTTEAEERNRSNSKGFPVDPVILEGKLYTKDDSDEIDSILSEISREPIEIQSNTPPDSPSPISTPTDTPKSLTTPSLLTVDSKLDDPKKKRISLDKISVTRIFEYTQDLKQLEMERPSYFDFNSNM
jgi:hypothetical protein